MKNKTSLLAAVPILVFSLSGCAYLRMGAPCYGFGCRASAPAAQTIQSITTPRGKDQHNGDALAKNNMLQRSDAQGGN